MTVYVTLSRELPDFGEYSYTRITPEEAKEILSAGEYVSTIRYQWAVDILRDLIGMDIPLSRRDYKLEVGDVAIVFSTPMTPGIEPAEKDISQVPYCLGLLKRVA